MNQLRMWTPFSATNKKAITSNSPTYRVDEVAAFNAFRRHWQHICEIFDQSKNKERVTGDDVTAVINHYGQMINLLLVDLRKMSDNPPNLKSESRATGNLLANGNGDSSSSSLHTPMFDLFLGERVLQAIFQWSVVLREFFNILQLEQLKVYETILSNSHPEILMYKPITEPLLDLLESCSTSVPNEVEKRLVVVLNQLWVSLLHNQHLLKYFLTHEENEPPKLRIFSLLLPFIHREGGLGQQSRDALLLCMSFSSSDSRLANYIFNYSNFCPVLAAGLSGLYSMLPRSLNINTEGWYRISPEDVRSTPSFQMLANSLGFCNAIVQSAHPSIRRQLIDYLYQGFLVPVVGPSLLQTVLDEVVAAVVYIEFFLQCITEPQLLRAFLALVLSKQEYAELPLLTSIISHLHSPNVQLNLVTLNLFNTLIDLYSEDVMVSLVFQYLTPCNHVMLSQRSKLSQPPSCTASRFLELFPSVCQGDLWRKQLEQERPNPDSSNGGSTPFSVYLEEARRRVQEAQNACASWSWTYDSQNPSPTEAVRLVNAAKVIPVIPYSRPRVESDLCCSYSLPFERTTSNVLQQEPADKRRSWSLPSYETKRNGSAAASTTARKRYRPKGSCGSSGKGPTWEPDPEDSRMDSLGGSGGGSSSSSSGYESFYRKGGSSCESSPSHNGRLEEKVPPPAGPSEEDFLDGLLEAEEVTLPTFTEKDLHLIDDLYNNFCFLSREPHDKSDMSDDLEADLDSVLNPITSTEEEEGGESRTSDDDPDGGDDASFTKNHLLESHPKPTIGPFLEALMGQIDSLMTSNVDASLLAMSCITKLASYPCPLLTSLILKPALVLQPAVRSLYQVLGQLKQKVDSTLDDSEGDFHIVIDAKIKFEQSLNTRQNSNAGSGCGTSATTASTPFSRENKTRRSFSQAWSSFFKKYPAEKSSKVEALVNLPDGSGYRYITSSPEGSSSPFVAAPREKRSAAVCAILLQEWLMELAAIAEEQSVASPVITFPFLSR